MPVTVAAPSTTPVSTTVPVAPAPAGNVVGAQGTVASNGTTATGATTGITGSAVANVVNPAPSVGSVEPPRAKAVMNGFVDGAMPKVIVNLAPPVAQLGTTESKESIDKEGWTTRGYFDVKTQPTTGGVNIDVETRHTRPKKPDEYQGDPIAYYLQARVLDEGKERVITLSTLFNGIANPDKTPTSKQRFSVNYDDINRWLQSKNPNLKFTPGDPLAVFGIWTAEGHQWGGFNRGGYFESPKPLGKQSAVDVRAGAATVATPTFKSTEFIEKPIDITLKVPDAVVETYNLVLQEDAKLVSRREHEQKFSVTSMDQLRAVTQQLLDVCNGTEEAREEWLLEIFGADPHLSRMAGYDVSGWHIHTTDRYYVKDEHNHVKLAPDGLPLIAAMVDEYQDNPIPKYATCSGYDDDDDDYSDDWDDDAPSGGAFPFAQTNAAARFRDGEIKAGESVGTMGKLNMKTARLTDPFTLTQTGLEISLDTRVGIAHNPDALKQLAKLLDNAPAPYSPLGEVKKSAPGLNGNDVTKVAVVNVANRYKFTLEHENGMELEVSMDFVHAGIVCKSVEPSPTKGMTEEQKYDHYSTLFETQDPSLLVRSSHALKTGATEKNQLVFADGANLVMAQLWRDENGQKHVSEHPCQRFPQVEIEMDHVQARTTGPVQAAYNKPTTSGMLTNEVEQDDFLKNVSDKVSMNGPPMVHTFEDLKNPLQYATRDYQEMQGAVTRFREGVFPQGVQPARQKSAMALELAGLIPKEKVELSATMPGSAFANSSIRLGYSRDKSKLCFMGDKLDGIPREVRITWNGFPMVVPLAGNETVMQVAEKVRAVLDRAVLYKATVAPELDNFGRDVVAVKVSPRE